jgi:hypothetical protein
MAHALTQLATEHPVEASNRVRGTVSASKALAQLASAATTPLVLQILPALPMPIVPRVACVLLKLAVGQACALLFVADRRASAKWDSLSVRSEG